MTTERSATVQRLPMQHPGGEMLTLQEAGDDLLAWLTEQTNRHQGRG